MQKSGPYLLHFFRNTLNERNFNSLFKTFFKLLIHFLALITVVDHRVLMVDHRVLMKPANGYSFQIISRSVLASLLVMQKRRVTS